jgi:prolyl oligopeptidase
VTFSDAFTALEEDTPEVLEWQAAQSRHAREALRGSLFEPLSSRVGQVLVDTRVYAPEHRGGRWFGLVLPPGAQQPVLQVQEQLDAPGRVLVDPDALSAEQGSSVSLDFSFPSPDGSRVAYGLSAGGNEAAVVHVLDVATGEVLPDRVPLTMASVLAWTPEADAFYFAAADPDAPTLQLVLHRHTLGGATERVPAQPAYRHPVVMPQLSADGRRLAAIVDHLAPRPDHVLDVESGLWRPFLVDAEGAFQGAFVGDDYVALSTHKAPRGRVVAVPLDAADGQSRWRELVPESDVVLRNVAVAGAPDAPLLVLSALVDAASRITVHDVDGRERHRLELPGRGTAGTSGIGYNLPFGPMTTAGASSRAAFVFTSFATSPQVLLADPRHR